MRFKLNTYSFNEERINVASHAIGLALSVIGTFLLLYNSIKYGEIIHIVSALIYGISLILLYTASTLYHKSTKEKLRKRLNVFDHASIFVLIAGSYTPFLLISLNGTLGWRFFIFIWLAAITGVILKLFFFGKYEILSTIMYIVMGWVIIFVLTPLRNNLDTNGVFWLFIGGVLYTLGAVFYSIGKLKMNHAIFHIFVLLGSISHFIAIYQYVIPNN